VAHYGRGRGAWVEGDHPPRWQRVAEEAIGEERAQVEALAQAAAEGGDAAAIARGIEPVLARSARHALVRLYPEAHEIFTR
jgi:hypothetical protein